MLYNFLNSKFVERTKRYIGLKTGIYAKVKRFTPSASEPMRTAMIIKSNAINYVIDVGANTGQFAESLFDFGYTGKVISFEPVKECHDILLKRSKGNKNWIIAERSAIGEKDEKSMINVSDDTVFSSLLEIKEWHADLKSKSKTIKQEEIQVNKLNTVIDKYIPNVAEQRILLKIDTQGYEKEVLAGASNLIDDLIGLKIEIPLTPIYEKIGFSFYDMFDYLKTHNFEPYSFNNEGVNLKTGRVNTIDGFFIRPNK